MAVVHYKFKNSVEYDSITFDGLSISLRDLKQSILRKKKMKSEDTDLQVVNAQSGEEYSSPSMMIPRNTSLIVARIPVGGTKKVEEVTPQTKAKKWAAFRKETQQAIKEAESGNYNVDKLKQSADLVNATGSEMEKIAQMIKQSTKDFDPSNYQYKFPTGTPSQSYVCYRCGKGGHFIQNCPNEPVVDENASDSPSQIRMKKPTGIPMEHMLIMSEPLPGTYKTNTGQYAVPKIDAVAYAEGKKERPPFLPELEKKPSTLKKPVPKELKCPLCGDIAKDAVVIPCCGISYCDECIRNKLLESEDHVCPSCDSMDVSPDGLIANQMLRRAVTNFQNETGYTKVAQSPAALKLAQAKVAEAARAAAAAGPVLLKQVPAIIVPRGPSVLDYRPPTNVTSPSPPQPKVVISPAPQMSSPPLMSVSTPAPKYTNVSATVSQEPPTPTLDEPMRSVSHVVTQVSSSAQAVAQEEALPTLVGMTIQPYHQNNQRRPGPPALFDNYYKPAPSISIPPPVIPHYPPPGFVPPVLPPPPFVPPPLPSISIPPPIALPPAAVFMPRPAIPPPVSLPKPLSEKEFLEEKERLRREELKKSDPLLIFAKELEQRGERKPRTRSRSRSLSRGRFRSRSRSRGRKSFSRSPRRSFTPRRSPLSPRRSYSPRRIFTKKVQGLPDILLLADIFHPEDLVDH